MVLNNMNTHNLSVSVYYQMLILSPNYLKAIWLSTKILIKIRT